MEKKVIQNIEGILCKNGIEDIEKVLNDHQITLESFGEKKKIKAESAKIDTYIHAYGILLALPEILKENKDEKICSLSLGAGNTGKDFDVETTHRVAEFKFSKWNEKTNSGRQDAIFKDFIKLLIYKSTNENIKKEIYCYSAKKVECFFEKSGRKIKSVLSNSITFDSFKEYVEVKKFDNIDTENITVSEFYNEYYLKKEGEMNKIKIISLEEVFENIK